MVNPSEMVITKCTSRTAAAHLTLDSVHTSIALPGLRDLHYNARAAACGVLTDTSLFMVSGLRPFGVSLI